jgi:DNA-binding response OmpR family regulator
MGQTAQQRIEELEAEVAFLKQELGRVCDVERCAKLKAAFTLTGKEAEILLLLYDRPRVLSKQAILSAVWGPDSDILSRTVDVFMCKLRKKLGFPSLETIWGSGYRLTPEGRQRVKEQLDILPS